MADGKKKVVRVFEDVGGYFCCDDTLPYLDTRGESFPTVREALKHCREFLTEYPYYYTHYTRLGRVRRLV